MNTSKLILYILVMAGVTYLVRMLPLAIFRKKITNRFVRSFLQYIPYAVLAAMVFPAILEATSSVLSGAVGLAVALLCSFLGLELLPVALLSCAGVFVCELLMKLL